MEDQPEVKKTSFFSTLKQNFIYIVMFGAIILAIFYSQDNKTDESIVEGEDQGLEIAKPKFPLKYILSVGVTLLVFIIVMVLNSKSFSNDAKKTQPVQKSFVARQSKEDYEILKAETTRRELEKLYQSPNFKRMHDRKGDNPSNWIWQTKEKDKKVVYRDNESSGDERLSQITVSDDE
jgi:hypothetical protein